MSVYRVGDLTCQFEPTILTAPHFAIGMSRGKGRSVMRDGVTGLHADCSSITDN